MERHAFFELVKDYESLGGNDYVHKVILPAMNELDVITMDNLDAVKELYDSRNAKHTKKSVKKASQEDMSSPQMLWDSCSVSIPVICCWLI